MARPMPLRLSQRGFRAAVGLPSGRLRWSRAAVRAVQYRCERHLIRLLREAHALARGARRSTVLLRDLEAAERTV